MLDPEISALLFGGMVERLRAEVGMIDWRQLITTSVITGITTIGIGYVAIKDQMAAQHAEIIEIRTLLSGRVAQRDAQIQAIQEEDRQIRAYVVERTEAVRSELITVRDHMQTCREAIAALRESHRTK